jgi:hypothetical protein
MEDDLARGLAQAKQKEGIDEKCKMKPKIVIACPKRRRTRKTCQNAPFSGNLCPVPTLAK